MREFAKVSPRFWHGETGRRLRGDRPAQLMAVYLLTAPSANWIGLYHLPLVLAAHDTGLELGEVEAALARLELEAFAHYDPASETVWVERMAAFQVGDKLEASDRRVVGLVRELEAVSRSPFVARWLAAYGKAYHIRLRAPRKGDGRPMQGAAKPLGSPFDAPSKHGDRDRDGDGARDVDGDSDSRRGGSSGESRPAARKGQLPIPDGY